MTPKDRSQDTKDKISALFRISRRQIGYFYRKQKTLCLREILNNLEKEILIEVLFRVDGKQRDAARFLDLKCSTLNEKIKRHNIKISRTKIQKINIEVN